MRRADNCLRSSFKIQNHKRNKNLLEHPGLRSTLLFKKIYILVFHDLGSQWRVTYCNIVWRWKQRRSLVTAHQPIRFYTWSFKSFSKYLPLRPNTKPFLVQSKLCFIPNRSSSWGFGHVQDGWPTSFLKGILYGCQNKLQVHSLCLVQVYLLWLLAPCFFECNISLDVLKM